jgi:hypothetical protein
MANITRNFTQGKMNKMVDERLVPNGEYIDALNVRMGSTEGAEIGVIENSKGNLLITNIQVDGVALSAQAKCIGAFEDGAFETIYWMIHDPAFTDSNTGKLDLIVSWNSNNNIVVYHIISKDDGGGVDTTLNFNDDYLFTGVDKVENLLFFTDNYNPPRKINVQKNYANPDASGVDGFPAEDILVIKKPPTHAPDILLLQTGSQENFLEERFICFGYRYKYDDDEYSATSQFTPPAFNPGPFLFSGESYLNEGVVNIYNTALVTFNTGGPLVKGVDLLFKEANSPVIKIIEKLNKNDQGYSDFQDVTYSFTNSKIFTILPEAEVLRLYDNVPLLAQASTLMGNRIMYGNYVEGYNMVTGDGNPVRLDYTTEAVSESFDDTDVEGESFNVNYTIDGSQTINDAGLEYDFQGVDLVEGATITVLCTFEHASFSGGTTPVETNEELLFQYTFLLQQDYASVYEWGISSITLGQLGTSLPGGNIQPMATRDDGSTMTDAFNRLFKPDLDGTELIYQSGISAVEQAIQLDVTPGSNIVKFRFPAAQYASPDIVTPTTITTEYFKAVDVELLYNKLGSGESLHSNRGYEVGIIYMDEFNRSTPALVSQYNTTHFSCDDSDTANSIYVNIPTSQIAPFWATNYKFAIKPDRETYETIYSSIFFTDPQDSQTYFLLQGENSQKITEGQRLIVKRDVDGPTSGCVFATVLEKDAKQKDFIEVASEADPTTNLPIPSGTYMKIKANSFGVQQGENAVVDYGCKSETRKSSGSYPQVNYPVTLSQPDPNIPGSTNTDYTIPANSRVTFDIEVKRRGSGNKCEGRRWNLEKTAVASQDYDNFQEWFEGDNIKDVLALGVSSIGNPGSGCDFDTDYVGTTTGSLPQDLCTIYFGFYRNSSTNQLYFQTRGTRACGSTKKRRSSLKVCITVFRAENTCVFESEPLDASPDIWYEGSETFSVIRGNNICNFTIENDDINDVVFDYVDINGSPQQVLVTGNSAGSGTTITLAAECGSVSINPSTPPFDPTDINIGSTPIPAGTHLGNIQNQVISTNQPAIIDSKFFNCYAFGNGVESYKIRDSVIGKDFKLGNRVTSTEAIDYSRVRRGADITYSGIYNDESNVNRLNEFNGGLLNFKALEESFGPIQKLFARETDVLTLQEDKISYVLQGKNLLSDAGAGNLLQSVPEVLGTQIARIEEFGISHNPESFAKWGPDKYFTDAKRGAVLKLSGTSYQNDSLETISGYGMRTWFRDLFNTQFETQKLGGFDPYMNEYVLNSNKELIPVEKECVACGVSQQLTILASQDFDACFEMGEVIGPVEIVWDVAQISGTFDVIIEYNGNTTTVSNENSSGSVVIQKNVISVTEINVTISSTNAVTLTLNVPCPDAKTITVIEVVATSANESGLDIHTQFRYVDGTFVSPLTSTLVQFDSGAGNPVVSYYNVVSGQQGNGAIPTTGSTVKMLWNKFVTDTAVWDNNTNKLRYLRTADNFANTSQSIAALIPQCTTLVTDTSGQPNVYTGEFTMPGGSDGDYLYLVWDLRKPTAIDLCKGNDLLGACCGCNESPD